MSATNILADNGEETKLVTIGEHTFDLRGGLLCLDFVNTVDNWHAPRRPDTRAPESDHLDGYGDLVDWSRQVNAVSERLHVALRTAATRRPEEADRVFRRASRFRTALHDALVVATEGGPPAAADLTALNAEIGPLSATSRLEPAGEAFVLARPGESDDSTEDLDRVLWPVVRSAIALLTSPDELARVRACPGEKCGWLFYNASGRRRWCSMASCGTRDKVRRFRDRQRAAAG